MDSRSPWFRTAVHPRTPIRDPLRELRLSILLESDCSCKICGITSERGAILHVDHIKPRSLYPDLALDKSNLQVLCEDCNIAKSNNDL